MPRLHLISSPIQKNEGFTLTRGSEASSTTEQKPHMHTEKTGYSRGQIDNAEPVPQFVKHEESTNIELFYDLFFVANLTTFSNVHEVNSRKTLTSYIGFFCVLWFTWCQTSLFDIRFVADSWLERVAKACHLGVMVGLAVVGPNYDTEVGKEAEGEGSVTPLQTMALILAASRFVLGLQYLLIMFQVRNFRKTKLPLGLMVGMNEVAALIYLVVSFAFKKHEHSYRAFYFVAGAEMVVNIAISSTWKVVGFKKTHLVERMSLLTLYILGEGVIDVLKSIGKIVQVKSNWTSATIGLIVAAIAAIYLLYMLYFDCLNHKHFGSIRQMIWAFGHFPFHVALVLSMSGMAQFVKWYKVVQVATPFLYGYAAILSGYIPNFGDVASMPELTNQTFTDLGNALNATIEKIFHDFPPEYTETYLERYDGITNITLGYIADNEESKQTFVDQTIELMYTVLHSIFTTYGFEGQENASAEKEVQTSSGELQADFNAIDTVFLYFLVAAGCTLIIMGFLSLIMDTHHRWGFGTIVRFFSHLVVGIAVALLAIMVNYEAGFNFAVSPWILPTYTLAVALVLGFHHIKWGARDREVDEIDYMVGEHE